MSAGAIAVGRHCMAIDLRALPATDGAAVGDVGAPTGIE
jgi:hypothetical protein